MLTLFNNITEEVTELEKKTLVKLLLNVLRNAPHGKTTKGKELCGYLQGLGFSTTEVRVRKMVNYIRVTNAAKPMVLIGCSKGYFLTGDLRTVDEQIESLEGRLDSMKAAIDAIKAQRLNLQHV